MMDTTERLVEMFGSGKKLDASIISAYTDVVVQYGTGTSSMRIVS
ncbi:MULTISPECIES: hypothetical protein [unclassified Paenibacillus]|nr:MULTISPECIES: hypothetical protein [unclassified Paenibacillus]